MENIANNYDEFVEKVSEGIRKALNTEKGQEITERLLRKKLSENPELTPEEWKKTKSDFMTFLFLMFVKETPQAMHEMAEHTYNLLNKGE